MVKFLLSIFFAAVGCQFANAASAVCDTAFINAFRQTLHVKEGLSLAQSAQDFACNESNQSWDVEASGYGSLKNSDVKKACQTHNEQFFVNHSQDLALSFIPADALKAITSVCGVGNSLSIDAEINDQTITISAHWRPGNNENDAEIKSFFYPKELADCKPLTFKKGAKIGNGDLQQFCKVVKQGVMTFGLETKRGSVYSVLKPKAPKATYTLTITGVDDQVSCALNGNLVASLALNQAPVSVVLMPKSGSNILICTPRDIAPDGNFNPCWSYDLHVTRNSDNVWPQKGWCCGSGCAKQPPILPYSFQYEE